MIFSSTDATGSYAFNLLDLATAGTEVTPGSLDPASGTLVPGSAAHVRWFTVDASASNQFSFDSISLTGGAARWLLVDPYGSVKFDTSFTTDQPAQTLVDGRHALVIAGDLSNDDQVSYAFQIQQSLVSPASSGGQPLVINEDTEGAITSSAPQDVFTLGGTRGQRLYLDGLDLTPDSGTSWSLAARIEGPGGEVIYQTTFHSASDSLGGSGGSSGGEGGEHPITLLDSGTYRVVVENHSRSTETGTFRFRVVDVSTQASLPIETATSGPLDIAARSQVFQFNGTAGERFALRIDPWASAGQLTEATGLLQALGGGGYEDGYFATTNALNNLTFRENAARTVLLISDENRDPQHKDLSYATMKARLQGAGVKFHSVVNMKIQVGHVDLDDNGEPDDALGID